MVICNVADNFLKTGNAQSNMFYILAVENQETQSQSEQILNWQRLSETTEENGTSHE